jgi:hypothetical protein
VVSSQRRAYDLHLRRQEAQQLNDRPQVDKFRELARQLETDDDEARFDERLKKLAKAPSQPKNDEPKRDD